MAIKICCTCKKRIREDDEGVLEFVDMGQGGALYNCGKCHRQFKLSCDIRTLLEYIKSFKAKHGRDKVVAAKIFKMLK